MDGRENEAAELGHVDDVAEHPAGVGVGEHSLVHPCDRRGCDDEEAPVEIGGAVEAADQRHAPFAGERSNRLRHVRRDDRDPGADVEQAVDLLERDRARADHQDLASRQVEAGHVVALVPAGVESPRSHASTLVTRAPCRSSLIVSFGPSVATARVKAPGPTAVNARRSRGCPWSEASASLTAAVLCQLRPGRELAERPESRLLAAGAVERADTAGLERQREQPVELGRVPLVDLRTVVERLEEVVEEVAIAAFVQRVADGLDLGADDFQLLAFEQDRRHAWASSPRIAWSSCSKPPVSIEQCMPHSFGASVSHHQRPARAGSPGAIARVQGAQPIEV